MMTRGPSIIKTLSKHYYCRSDLHVFRHTLFITNASHNNKTEIIITIIIIISRQLPPRIEECNRFYIGKLISLQLGDLFQEPDAL